MNIFFLFPVIATFAIVKIRSDIVVDKLGGMTIVRQRDLTGVQKTQVISMSASSAWLILAMTGKEFSEEDAVCALMSHYDVDEITARGDVAVWIKTLKDGGIIE